MRRRRRAWLVLVVALSVGAVCAWVVLSRTTTWGYKSIGSPANFRASKIEPDDRPRFGWDGNQSWRVEFGRGSGMDGLDTVVIDQDGSLVLHRRKWEPDSGGGWETDSGGGWETASAQLSREDVKGIVEAVEVNDLLGLAKAYHADVFDGTQWVLWILQGTQEKAVYFNNHFPDSILRFADRLDEIISRSVGPDLQWRGSSEDHQQEIWDSIRR